MDKCVSGEKVLCLLGRFEPLHLSLSSSRRWMSVLDPIVMQPLLSFSDRAAKPG
jgi:hypothetical protein